MITSFEVGAVFRIINEASPALVKILKQVRELSVAIEKARANLALVAKPASMGVAIAETGDLAKAWGDVAKQAGAARLAIGRAASASGRAALSAPAIASAAGGGGGRGRSPSWPGYHGSGGVHVAGPGVGLPGGAHMRFSGGASGMAAGAAGLLGYAGYEAAELEKMVWWLGYHNSAKSTPETQSTFRKTIQDSMSLTGYSLKDVGEAALDEMRMFKGTPGGGTDVMSEMLKAASIESLAKGESLKESMKAFIGLSHMTKEYSPEEIKKLAPSFAFLSTANPSRLSSIERSAGYAVPILQSSLGVDPTDALLLGTALTRAGITNTKSGTWLREMAIRAMPGTAIFESEKKAEHHDELLKKIGLLDENGKPTWLTNGKADPIKMLDIAGPRLAALPIEERVKTERLLFGAQGSGAVAVLSDQKVHEQIGSLRAEMNSPDFQNKYSGFFSQYNNEVTAQSARVAMAEFNNTMIDIGTHTLPAVNQALKDFTAALVYIRSLIPGASNTGSVIGARGIEGALGGAAAGAIYGSVGGPVGAIGGAVVGGTMGVAMGYLEQQARENKAKWEAEGRERSRANLDALRGAPGGTGGVFPGGTRAAPAPVIHLNLNVDGRALAAVVSEQQNSQSQYTTDTPASNGTSLYGP